MSNTQNILSRLDKLEAAVYKPKTKSSVKSAKPKTKKKSGGGE